MNVLNHSKKGYDNPIKRCYRIGSNIVVSIDKEIVEKLKISEEDTILEQQIVGESILMKIKKVENSVATSGKSD